MAWCQTLRGCIRAEEFTQGGGGLTVGLCDFLSAGLLNDLHVFDPAIMSWSDLSGSISGTPPEARYRMGMTSSADGKLYVFGGYGKSGEHTLQRDRSVHAQYYSLYKPLIIYVEC